MQTKGIFVTSTICVQQKIFLKKKKREKIVI